MNFGTIITWLIGIWRLFRGGGSSRVKVDIRSERAIKAERERIEKLKKEVIGLDEELKNIIHKIIVIKQKESNEKNPEKLAELIKSERNLNDKRDKLFADYNRAKREYDDAKGRIDT